MCYPIAQAENRWKLMIPIAFLRIPREHLRVYIAWLTTHSFLFISCRGTCNETPSFTASVHFLIVSTRFHLHSASTFSDLSYIISLYRYRRPQKQYIKEIQSLTRTMSQIGRQLETPRPLKSSIKQQQSLPMYQQQQSFEVNSSRFSYVDIKDAPLNPTLSLSSWRPNFINGDSCSIAGSRRRFGGLI